MPRRRSQRSRGIVRRGGTLGELDVSDSELRALLGTAQHKHAAVRRGDQRAVLEAPLVDE